MMTVIAVRLNRETEAHRFRLSNPESMYSREINISVNWRTRACGETSHPPRRVRVNQPHSLSSTGTTLCSQPVPFHPRHKTKC